MDHNTEDILLEDLELIDSMTIRAINICRESELTSLNKILEFFDKHKSFGLIRNCGNKTNLELIALCKKYKNGFKKVSSDLTLTPENFSSRYDEFNPIQKEMLNKYFELLTSSLSVRSSNGLRKLCIDSSTKKVIESIIQTKYCFSNIPNIGNKSIGELENFRKKMIQFIEILPSINKSELTREHVKMIIKTNFSSIPSTFENDIEYFYEEHGKIRLFAILNYLIESSDLFNNNEREVFRAMFMGPERTLKKIEGVAKITGLTKERVRQLAIRIQNDLQSYFNFILSIPSEDFLMYNASSSGNMVSIDRTLVEKINNNENVKFNSLFYSEIFGLLLQSSHRLIKSDIFRKAKSERKKHSTSFNAYLVAQSVTNDFNLESFIMDIGNKKNEKITDPYSLHFLGYIHDFWNSTTTMERDRILDVCKELLFSEFDLVVDENGYLTFDVNSKKLAYQYYLQILEEHGDFLTINEIAEISKVKFPHLTVKEDSIRATLNREKNVFIYIGRTSTYGLKVWEDENDNIQGGTIREIIADFLQMHDDPQHVSTIMNHLLNFRDTNEKSIRANLKMDGRNRFVFFEKSYYGLNSKTYKSKFKIQQITEVKYWNDNFNDLVNFRARFPSTWPSASAKNKEEKRLGVFYARQKWLYRKGTLEAEKVELLISIGVDFEHRSKSLRTNWYELSSKMLKFIEENKRFPSANSAKSDERVLYRFYYTARKEYKLGKLSDDKINILNMINLKLKT